MRGCAQVFEHTKRTQTEAQALALQTALSGSSHEGHKVGGRRALGWSTGELVGWLLD